MNINYKNTLEGHLLKLECVLWWFNNVNIKKKVLSVYIKILNFLLPLCLLFIVNITECFCCKQGNE